MVKCTDNCSSRMMGCLAFCQEVVIDQKKNLHLFLWGHKKCPLLAWYPYLTWLLLRDRVWITKQVQSSYFFFGIPFPKIGIFGGVTSWSGDCMRADLIIVMNIPWIGVLQFWIQLYLLLQCLVVMSSSFSLHKNRPEQMMQFWGYQLHAKH